MKDLAQKPVRERVAETIILLKEKYGFKKDNETVNVSLSREELANITGTAPETLIRFLSEFNKDGIIEISGKKIKIRNLKKLVATANIAD